VNDKEVGHQPTTAPTIREHISKVLIAAETGKEVGHRKAIIASRFCLEHPHNYSFSSDADQDELQTQPAMRFSFEHAALRIGIAVKPCGSRKRGWKKGAESADWSLRDSS
jgi:hypothetical protein